MKITVRGTVTRVGEPRQAGQSKLMEVYINKKYHDPETGEFKAEDTYPVQIWEDKWPLFHNAFETSNRMEITGFLNGRLVEKDGNASCFMNFTASSFKNY